MKMIAGLLLLAVSQDVSTSLARFRLFNNCEPIRLVVENLPTGAAAIGLTEERVSALAESRLRAARLFSGDAAEYLYVAVGVVGAAFAVSVSYHKRLFDPVSGEAAYPRTWVSNSFGTHDGNSGFILQNLSEPLDRFVLEYLRVNEDACR